MRRARSALRGRYLIVALLVGAVYANTLGHGFVWDDPHLITRNVDTHRLRSIPLHFASEFLEGRRPGETGPVNAYWRPVVLVTLTLDHALWGLAPAGYHLTNVLLHALNAALVFLLFRTIPRTRAAAFPAAILFACHPLQTNAVAYISGRTDLLAALFVLLGCILLARRLALPAPSGAGGASACAVGFCTALAAMSKESAFAAPLLLLLTGALSAPPPDGGDPPPAPGRGGAILRLAGASAAALCLVLVCRRLAGLPSPATAPPSLPVVLAAAKSIFVYAALVVFPVGLHMERFLPVPALPTPATLLPAAALLLAAFVVARALLRRGTSPVPLLLCWALAALLPAGNLLPLYPAYADREIFIGEQFLYLPLAGVSGAIACAWVSLLGGGAFRRLRNTPPHRADESAHCEGDVQPGNGDKRRAGDGTAARTAWRAGGVAALLLLSALARLHNDYWRDAATFYSETVARGSHSERMLINLGLIRAVEGRCEESERILRNVAARNPRSLLARLSLAHTYLWIHRPDKARAEIEESARIAPGSPEVLAASGLLLLEEGRPHDAVRDLSAAVAAAPRDPALGVKLASACLAAGEPERAERAVREALAVDPTSFEARMLLAVCCERQGKRREAFEAYREIARRRPDFGPAVERAHRLMRESN
jgi:Tfp pilus assembly protein PilF